MARKILLPALAFLACCVAIADERGDVHVTDSDDLHQMLDDFQQLQKEHAALVKAVEQLKLSVARLRAELRANGRTTNASPVQTPKRVVPRKPATRSVNDVFRSQRESPGDLLKDIHSRERELRRRPFPAEMQN